MDHLQEMYTFNEQGIIHVELFNVFTRILHSDLIRNGPTLQSTQLGRSCDVTS